MELAVVYWGCIGIVEKNMQAAVVYWGYIEKMEEKRYSNCC